MSVASSWVEGASEGFYDVDNLPYAVFSAGDAAPRVGVRIADLVVDLHPLATAVGLGVGGELAAPSLAPLMRLGRDAWQAVRGRLVQLLTDPTDRPAVEPCLIPIGDVHLQLPYEVADYVDFYCSLHHATRVGEIFRPGTEPLPEQWRQLPIGYHGRAGTLRPSGTPVVRPRGLRRGEGGPKHGPTERLDVEAELAFAVGPPTATGSTVPTSAFADHVFGVQLLNDWSARDIQAYESVPLGPFLGKSFATSISAWVTPLEALAAARVDLPGQDPTPAEHLRVDEPAGYAIDIEIAINGTVIARCPYSSMYWSPAQMLAHLTSNGASLRTGDVFASGSVSGLGDDQRGCLLELTLGGESPLTLADGWTRTWLQDGDEVVLTATAPGTLGGGIALGEVRGTITPAR